MRTHLLLAAALAVTALAFPANASIQNLGVDIAPNGTQTVTPFFDESQVGQELDGAAFYILFGLPGESLTITLNTAAAFGPGPITAAELFIDGYDIETPRNTSEVYVQGVLVGSLLDTADPSMIPVETGPVGTHVANPNFDVDNTFFNLAPFLSQLATDTTFTIEIRNTTWGFLQPGDHIRIDGINIQVNTNPPAVVSEGGMPEPMTLAIWSGLAAVGGVMTWRRKRAV